MNRYDQLLTIIDLIQPKSIIETGVFNGINAIRMIQRAEQYHPKITYTGFDLFEDATAETDAVEYNVKKHCGIEAVGAKIQKHCPNAFVILFKGDTKKTLPDMVADMAFIDGGHSVETIANDYERLRSCSTVVFDDYYSPNPNGACPDITKVGCNFIKGLVLPVKHPLKDDAGFTQMMMVVNVH